MIVVTGPTGNTGRMVIEGLRARAIPFRAMVRDEGRRSALDAQGFPTVHGDFSDRASLVRALDGADTAYLVCTPDERLVPCETAFIAAAREAGVQRVVKCSAHSAAHDAGSPNLRAHARIEDDLKASGLRWTIVRPHGFMQTFFWMSAPMVMEHGVLSYPAGDGPLPLIDLRDVGEAMLTVLTRDGFDGSAFDLTGPEALRPSQMADALSVAFGRTITYVDGPLEALDGIMRQMGVPDAPREHVLWCFREQRAGRFDYTSDGHRALGLKLHSYAEFAADVAAGRTGVATSEFSR